MKPGRVAGLLAIALLFLGGDAPAQETVFTVTFHTRPSGAEILLQGPHPEPLVLGVSGKPIPMGPRLGRKSYLDLVFRLPGYEQKLERGVPVSNLKRLGRYPENGTLALTPMSPLYALRYTLRDHPLAALLLLMLALAGGLGLGQRRRRLNDRLARGQRLADLEAALPADREDPLLMKTVAGYRLVEKVGSGGMATVYKALPDQGLRDSQAVALKLIRRDLSADPKFQRRFRREMTLGLHHPSIVRVEDFGDHEGLMYLVMELVEGETLADRIPPSGLPLSQALPWLSQIAEALAFAHAAGTIHRDLKPENVKLTAEGQLKLLDFGLAHNHKIPSLTGSGEAWGTPGYMAPEQIRDEELDPRCDQFGLGVLAYEMLSGRQPFAAETKVATLYKTLDEEPSPLPAAVPPEVGKSILKMMSKEPEDRFKDVLEALECLESAAGARP